jgi:hypothetical protein
MFIPIRWARSLIRRPATWMTEEGVVAFTEMTFDIADEHFEYEMTVTVENGETFIDVRIPHRDDPDEVIDECALVKEGEDFIDVALRLMHDAGSRSETDYEKWSYWP